MHGSSNVMYARADRMYQSKHLLMHACMETKDLHFTWAHNPLLCHSWTM